MSYVFVNAFTYCKCFMSKCYKRLLQFLLKNFSQFSPLLSLYFKLFELFFGKVSQKQKLKKNLFMCLAVQHGRLQFLMLCHSWFYK